MAKDRHRIFEIYETRDEAAWELMPKGNKVGQDVAPAETQSFKQITVSRLAGIIQIRFNEDTIEAQDIVTQVQDDLVQLADQLSGNSRVLIDFTGVQVFGTAGINALMAFNKKLHIRGSRMVLCCFEPNVRTIFFAEN